MRFRIGDEVSDPYIKEAISERSTADIRADKDGNLKVVSAAQIDIAGLDWHIVTTIAADEALSPKLKGENSDFFSKYVANFGYHDLFLINPDGFVFYSVARESDYRTNMISGRFADSNFSRLIKNVMLTRRYSIADYEPYAPSKGEQSAFIAQPIIHNGLIELIVALQLSNETLNLIMQERSGMGKTGETYLVGQVGDKSSYRNRRVIKQGEVGQQKTGRFVRLALNGESGSGEKIGSTGQPELVSYTGLDIPGLKWGLMATISRNEIQAPIRTLTWNIIITAIFLSALTILAAYLFGRSVVNPISDLIESAAKIADGNWSERSAITGQDELGRLGAAFNRMAERIEEYLWIKSNASEFPAIMQKASGIDDFADNVLGRLIPLLGAAHGVFYIWSQEHEHYQLAGNSRYGRSEIDQHPPAFKLNEGLVGRCAVHGKIVLLTDIPAENHQIATGSGVVTPVTIMAIPIPFHGQSIAVMEIVFFGSVSQARQDLVSELTRLIGLNLENLKRSQRMANLLIETQQQAEELSAQTEELETQQEELRQTNESLEKQTSALQASEEELRSQQEELRVVNESVLEKSRHLAEQKRNLEKAHDELAQSSRYKSEFLANMSHELRTPLNSLLILAKSFAENEDGNLTATQIQEAEIIHGSGSDLLMLINEILDLSKIEAGRMEVNNNSVNIATFAKGIKQQFQHMAEDKKLLFSVDVADNTPERIITDVAKMGQILKNFIANAFKFTNPEGKVQVLFQPAEGLWSADSPNGGANKGVAISVTDTGIGIAEDKLQLIFDAFSQGDGSTSRKYGGTGLGLSISKELTRLLGGEIQLQSRQNHGSTFTLLLPEKNDGPADAGKQAVTVSVEPTASEPLAKPVSEPIKTIDMDFASIDDDRDEIAQDDRTILIIEDDAVFAGIVRDEARNKGFKALCAPTGEAGLILAMQYKPTGIILDLGLPGMSGIQVMERLKQGAGTRHIPIHIVSAKEENREALRKGAIGHLVKPVEKDQILDAFSKLDHFAGQHVRTLLLVEDNPQSKDTTSSLLAGKDIDITTVASGAETMEILKKIDFDCMILDLGLPDIDGFELLDMIEADQSLNSPPVIIYSGKELSRQEYERLKKYTDSIVIKGVQSAERLVDEVVLFLHRMEHDLPERQKKLLKKIHDQESIFQGKTVLIVDDDVRSAYALSKSLDNKGLNSIMASNGEDALAMLAKHSTVDVILMDIMMPVMDGYQAMREIRKREDYWQVPIIALTAKAMEEDRENCMNAGASHYLSKPVDMERLFSLLQIILYQ